MAEPKKTWQDYLREQGLDPDAALPGVPEATTTDELVQAIPEELPVSPGALQQQQRAAQSAAFQHALDTAQPGESRFDSAARAEELAAPIVETRAPPNPVISGPVDALGRAYYGSEYPLVKDLPAHEQALYALETVTPSLAPGRPMLEAARTGDIGGAIERYGETAGQQTEALGRAAGGALGLPTGGVGLEDAGTVLSRETRIGDDVVLSESPTQRLLRVGGTAFAGVPTSIAHEALKDITPRDVLKSPLERATGYRLPALLDPIEAMRAHPDAVRKVVDLATGKGVWNEGEWGDVAVAMTQNPDRPFITERAEVVERGELPWSWTSDSYMPEAIRDPLASYVQEVARGRGLREQGAEMAITAGFQQDSPQYEVMSRTGLVADVVVPLDELPVAALGRLVDVGTAGAMGAKLDRLAGTGNHSTAFAAAMAEIGRTGGSVDAIKPAVAGYARELAGGRGVEALDRMRASGYTGRKLAETIDGIFYAQHGKTIAQHLADAKRGGGFEGPLQQEYGPSAWPGEWEGGSVKVEAPLSEEFIGPVGPIHGPVGEWQPKWKAEGLTVRQRWENVTGLAWDEADEVTQKIVDPMAGKPLPDDALPDDPINGPIWRAAQEAEAFLVRLREADVTERFDPGDVLTPFEDVTEAKVARPVVEQEVTAKVPDLFHFEEGTRSLREEAEARALPEPGEDFFHTEKIDRSMGATFVDMVLSEWDELPLDDVHDFLRDDVTSAAAGTAYDVTQRIDRPLTPEVTESGVTMRIPRGRPREEAGVARADIPVVPDRLNADGTPKRPLPEVSSDPERGWRDEGYQAATSTAPQRMRLRAGGLLDEAIERQAKRTAREQEELRLRATKAESRAQEAEAELAQLPKYTAAEESAREASMRATHLVPQAVLDAVGRPDMAGTAAAAARSEAERFVRPDLRRTMLALADIIDPATSLEVKHSARVEIELFQQRPVADVPVGEIADAVARGEITRADAERAIGLAGTQAAGPAVGSVPQMRQFAMDPTSGKDFAGFYQRLVDRGGVRSKDQGARLQEIAALAQERGAKFRYGDQGDPSWLDVLEPDLVTEFVAIKAKRLQGKARRLLGKAEAAKIDQFDLARLLFEQGFHPDAAVRQAAIGDLADLSHRLDVAEGKERLATKRAPVKAADEAGIAAAVEAVQPPPTPVDIPFMQKLKNALGHRLGKPGGGATLPLNPRRALEEAGFKESPAAWDFKRALDTDKRDGSFDFKSRLLETRRDLDGEKYVLVNELTGERVDTISGDKAGILDGESPNCAATTIGKRKYRRPGWRIMVKGSDRPIAEWVALREQPKGPNGKRIAVELRPVYGASAQEAEVVRKLAAKIEADELVSGGHRIDDFNQESLAASRRSGRRGAVLPILPELIEAAGRAVKSPLAPDLTPELQIVADAVEAGMRSYMRAGTRRVPFVGGLMVTPHERTVLMRKMKNELAPLYDIDAYYSGKGGIKTDSAGQLILTPDQRQVFWNLSEKYGLPTPDVARAERGVTPLDTRKLHGAMAQVMAGRSAWMAHAFPEVSAWSWVAQSALARASFNTAEDYLQRGSEKLGGATRALFDVDGARLRLVSPAAANELDRWVHTLSGVAIEVSRKVQEARAAGTLQSKAMWEALAGEGWKPIGEETSRLIDQGLTKGLSIEDAGRIADQILATEDVALPARLRGDFEADVKAGVPLPEAKAKLAKKWASQRAAERRKYARWWVDAVAPGLKTSQVDAVLRQISPDRDAALDRVYHDAFVNPRPEGFGQFERPSGFWTSALEWYRGGGKLGYLTEHTSLGRALRQHVGRRWSPPAEDVTVFNFAVRLRSEAVYQDAMAAILGNHMAVPKGRISELVADILGGNPDAATMAYAAERGYAPTDLIEAQQVIRQMGLDTGDRASLHALGGDDDVLTTKYITDTLEEAKGYGLTDSSDITGWKSFDAVMRFWKQSALGKQGLLSSPARFIGDALGAFPQAYLVRGWDGVGDIVKHGPDPAAWALGGHLAEMRHRKFSPSRFASFRHRTFTFPTGVWTADELLEAFRARGLDAQAARSENAAQLIDESRRFDFDAGRRVFAMEDRAQLANEVSNLVDMQFRVRVALGELRRGADIDTACRAAREALYDYSGLTKVERHLLRAVFPWYTFMKRNAEAVLKALITNPQRVAYLSRLSYKQPDLWGWDKDEKSRISPSGWGGVWFASERGELDTDHKGRSYAFTGVNPIDVMPMVVGLVTDPVEAVPETLKQNLNPFLFHAIEDALAGAGQRPEWSERGNEVPAAFMLTPGMGPWMKWALGVEAVPLGEKDDRSRATTWDEHNQPQKWVVGHRFDQQGAPFRAQMAREAWWAMMTMGGRIPEQQRAWASWGAMQAGAPFPEETRPPDQSTEGAFAQAMGGRAQEQLSRERLLSDARRNAVREMREKTTEAFGPKNTMDAGVGSYQR